MTAADPRYEQAIALIDEANSEDPNTEEVDGQPFPSTMLYGRRMSEWLEKLDPDAPTTMRLAARAQHIRRWSIDRKEFPEGVKGYNQWRRAVALMHADTAGEILRRVGYEEETTSAVERILRREKRTSDPDVQMLEDLACLVFLEFYFHDFADKFGYDDEKLVDIVQKTWRKMSPTAHEAATKIALPPREQKVVATALGL